MVNSKRRLAIFLPTLSGGGAERAMLNLAQGLTDKGCGVDLVLAQATGPYLTAVSDPIRIIDLKASRALSSLPALTRYLRREKPAALLSALDYANVIAVWARRLAGTVVRTAVNEQNTISVSATNSVRRRQRIVPRLAKQFYPWADYVIGNSQGVADDLREVTGLPKERIQILYNPVVTPELRKKAAEPLDHPWFETGQPPVVLAVGRLAPQKDFPTLIQAFAQVRKNRPARLLILGEGPERPLLETLIHELNLEADVSLPGFVANPNAYMRHASTFVLSSRWEGLPTVLIEALYCGAPIVATDCPSGPKEILANGKYGALVPMKNVKVLAQTIEASLDGKTPHPTVESWRPYSQEVIVDQYIKLLLDDHA